MLLTDKQTNTTENMTFFAKEVIKLLTHKILLDIMPFVCACYVFHTIADGTLCSVTLLVLYCNCVALLACSIMCTVEDLCTMENLQEQCSNKRVSPWISGGYPQISSPLERGCGFPCH